MKLNHSLQLMLKMTDICKEKCLVCWRGMGALPQCISDKEYETQSSNIPPAMAESTQDTMTDMMDLLITIGLIGWHEMHSIS